MKKVLLSVLSILFVATIVCCDEDGNPVQRVGLRNFANSGCKGNTRAADDDRAEFVEYSVIHEGFLYINHQNARFNCCPGELRADIFVSGNVITINEYDTKPGCRCICPYDLSYEVGPLTEGETYAITICQRGVEPIVEKVEFNNSVSGVWKTR